MFFGHVRRVADAIDRTAGHVNEPLDPGIAAGLHHRLETLVINRAAQRRIEVEAGIVGNASHVDHLVHSLQAAREPFRVPDIAGDELQVGMGSQSFRAEEHQVIHHHPVARLEQLGHQHTPFVSRSASD